MASASAERLQSLPLHRAHECRTQVDHPAYAGDFAFVSYVSQSGKLGAMASSGREESGTRCKGRARLLVTLPNISMTPKGNLAPL
jgi:hypothetical protein